MKIRNFFTPILITLVCLAFASPVLGGGWAVLTLDSLPGNLVAGETFTVSFKARQHGHTLLNDLSPRVVATHVETGKEVIVDAQHGAADGQYLAVLKLPEAGVWRWKIHAWHNPRMPDLVVAPASAALTQTPDVPGLGLSLSIFILVALTGYALIRLRQSPRTTLALLAVCLGTAGVLLLVARPGTSTYASVPQSPLRSQAEIGHDLFIAKGCLSCHVNADIEPRYLSFSSQIGPDLTEVSLGADYLRQWLAEPASLKPATLMPDLDLSQNEIESLIAFLRED